MGTNPPLDQAMYQRLHHAWASARTRGFDPFEEMNRRGLILTPEGKKIIQVSALTSFGQQLDLWRPAELFHRTDVPRTPADMLEAVKRFLDRYIDQWKESW